MADRLDIKLLAVDHLEVIDLAAKARLTTYDASYLWLARKTGGELEAIVGQHFINFTRPNNGQRALAFPMHNKPQSSGISLLP